MTGIEERETSESEKRGERNEKIIEIEKIVSRRVTEIGSEDTEDEKARYRGNSRSQVERN